MGQQNVDCNQFSSWTRRWVRSNYQLDLFKRSHSPTIIKPRRRGSRTNRRRRARAPRDPRRARARGAGGARDDMPILTSFRLMDLISHPVPKKTPGFQGISGQTHIAFLLYLA